MKSKKTILLICVCALLAIAAALFFFHSGVLTSNNSAAVFEADSSVGTEDTSSTGNAARAVPAGMKEYRSNMYHFSLFYPDSLSVKEYDEGGAAETIVFQNPNEALGFQIFVEPYTAPQVTEVQFLKDDPSGVKTNVMSTTTDGATTAIFDSKDAQLGATHEVWLLRGGYLYEVTTLQPLGSWLTDVMQTWQFI